MSGSPPLTVLSVITYRKPASTSKRTSSKTSSITARSPLAPVLHQGDPGDLLDRRIGERQVCPVEPDEFSELSGQRMLRRLENPGEILNAQGIERGDHRQPSDDLRDQPEGFQVVTVQSPVGTEFGSVKSGVLGKIGE